jgi:hypothetical protein
VPSGSFASPELAAVWVRVSWSSAVAEDAFGCDEYGDSSFFGHCSVVFVEVVVGASGGMEDLAQQESERLVIDDVGSLAWADEFGLAGQASTWKRSSIRRLQPLDSRLPASNVASMS